MWANVRKSGSRSCDGGKKLKKDRGGGRTHEKQNGERILRGGSGVGGQGAEATKTKYV